MHVFVAVTLSIIINRKHVFSAGSQQPRRPQLKAVDLSSRQGYHPPFETRCSCFLISLFNLIKGIFLTLSSLLILPHVTCKSMLFLQNDRILVFPDIKPSAVRHLLVVPKSHIANTDSLVHSDLELGA
jgi:hypothetical protein